MSVHRSEAIESLDSIDESHILIAKVLRVTYEAIVIIEFLVVFLWP